MSIQTHLTETFCRNCGQGLRENFQIVEHKTHRRGTTWFYKCLRCQHMGRYEETLADNRKMIVTLEKVDGSETMIVLEQNPSLARHYASVIANDAQWLDEKLVLATIEAYVPSTRTSRMLCHAKAGPPRALTSQECMAAIDALQAAANIEAETPITAGPLRPIMDLMSEREKRAQQPLDEFLAELDETPGHDALHQHFGLSYASYLTIPRSVLQSMPDQWQGNMASLLREVDQAVDQHNVHWPPPGFQVIVELRPEGQDVEAVYHDELANYARGRRRLW